MDTTDAFQKVFVVCMFLALLFAIFQVWWEKKRGTNVRDLRIPKIIVYRSLPILIIPFFFMGIPWVWRILFFIISIIGMEGYFLLLKKMRKLLGTDKYDKKDIFEKY